MAGELDVLAVIFFIGGDFVNASFWEVRLKLSGWVVGFCRRMDLAFFAR